MEWQLINSHFYDKLVPEITRNRNLNPPVKADIHVFLKEKTVYGLTLNATQDLHLVDFEEDPWRHDCQYTINEKPKKLFDVKELSDKHKDVNLQTDEEILPHFVIPLSSFKFLVYPLKEAIFLTRGMIVECMPNSEPKVISLTTPPPEQLLRPGVCPQTKANQIKEIMFLGGNESKQNYVYNLETDKWTKAGKLPDFHIVTEQISVVHNEKQTISLFTQVNFDKNLFEICMASNNGNLDEDHTWTWVYKETTDIQNFHIKSAILYDNKLIITANR